MIFSQNIFNNATLNIFTDASILRTENKEMIGCAGRIAVTGSDPETGILDTATRIIRNSTNNHSEITAVSMGIDYAIANKGQFTRINLFSDSKICIYGLRDWIFKWVARTGNSDTLVGYSGQEISNQDVIMDIVYKILDNDLSISFFNQYGHVSVNNSDSMAAATKAFIELNRLNDQVHPELIRQISVMNNHIDKLTRLMLNKASYFPEPTTDLVKFVYRPFDVQKYAKLINIIQ